MSQAIICILIGAGIGLLMLGIALGGLPDMLTWARQEMLGMVGLCLFGRTAGRALLQWRHAVQARRAQMDESPLAARLTPQLFGDYTPYVIEAAEKLGQERDTTAVPALLRALEQSVDTQRPGWRDQAAALACALAQIGDRRALPLLYRLDNVRGIGFIPAIRSAITAIEPQTSLLRPSYTGFDVPETLLRPAHDMRADVQPAVLLRAIEAPDEH
jgi:hypothetical protein